LVISHIEGGALIHQPTLLMIEVPSSDVYIVALKLNLEVVASCFELFVVGIAIPYVELATRIDEDSSAMALIASVFTNKLASPLVCGELAL
jgi:hypothetical protein